MEVQTLITYKGVKRKDQGGAGVVFRMDQGDIRILDPGPSQKIVNHSPDGFQWGYGGSGPSQLSLALLFDVTGNSRTAWELHQDFKRDFVATWNDEFVITADVILDWLKKQEDNRSLTA
jgi:hypothetical protein